MPALSVAFARQRLCLEFASLKHAAPEGIYVAPEPDDPLLWTGVLFVRKGPYADAILRFRILFPVDFPARAPIVCILTDVFHPLVSPLTTYTSSARDAAGGETVSATDADRLPPGGLSLRHGFPEWFSGGSSSSSDAAGQQSRGEGSGGVHALEVLLYLRVVFDTEAVLDAAPLESAANSSAWHAWRSFRGQGVRPTSPANHEATGAEIQRSVSPRQQPGGARRPGEWNWQGVWEDRVRKCVRASASEHVLFGGDQGDVLCFSKIDAEAAHQMVSWVEKEGIA